MIDTNGKTKKLVAVLLASAMTLAACGGNESDDATDDAEGLFVPRSSEEETTDTLGRDSGSDEADAMEDDEAMEDSGDAEYELAPTTTITAEAMEDDATADEAAEETAGGFFDDGVDEDRTEDNTFADYGVRPFVDTDRDPFSTFALDVDTASYNIAQQWLSEGVMPPAA